MVKFFRLLFQKINYSCKCISTLIKANIPLYPYRVLSIELNENENYIAVIQISNKKEIFRMQPEEILANDNLTDSFSQRDIRTLTYLGYLGINSPKYKILAKRLSENDSKLIFAIQERGKKKTFIKTAVELSSDDSLISGFHQKDAQMIGYAMATEQIIDEEKQKIEIIKNI